MLLRKYIAQMKAKKVKNKAKAAAVHRLVSGVTVYFAMRDAYDKMLAAQRREKTKEYIYHRGAYEALVKCFKPQKEKNAVTSRSRGQSSKPQ